MNEIKVCFDRYRLTSPPRKADINLISDRIGESIRHVSRENIKTFAHQVGSQGHAFCPATFKNGERLKENFNGMQFFPLEFGQGTTFEEVKAQADLYDMPVLFAYDMLSDTEHKKLGVVFLNNKPIPHPKIAEAMLHSFETIFPKADKSKSRDISNMLLGGTKLLYFDESIPTIGTSELLRTMTLRLRDEYGKTHYHRKVSEFSKKYGFGLNPKKLIDTNSVEEIIDIHNEYLDGNNSPDPFIQKTIHGEKLPNESDHLNHENSSSNSSGIEKSSNHLPFTENDLNKISSNCQLYQEFESGSRILSYFELFGLATNLVQIRSGSKRFKYYLKHHAYFDDMPRKYSHWEHRLHEIRTSGITLYSRYGCAEFCPHKDTCPHGENIISTWIIKRKQMERLVGQELTFVPIEETEKDFARALTRAMDAIGNMLYAIKAQTGLGKTEIILRQIKAVSKSNPSFRILVAVPRLDLKSEICARAAKMGIEMTESPSLRELENVLPDDVCGHIEELYGSGKSPIPYIKKLVAKKDVRCADVLEQYLEELDLFKNCEGHAITTHQNLLNMNVSNYDLVIIDEDIIHSIIQNKVDLVPSDLMKMRKKFAKTALFGAIMAKLRMLYKRVKTHAFFTLSKVHYDRAEDDDIPMGVDIPSFASATQFLCRKTSNSEDEGDTQGDCISFIKPTNFLKNINNTKVIMVSATIDETICQYYFGEDNVDFYECKIAKYRGTFNQYWDRSMGRSDIAKDPSIISTIQKATGFLHTITFKALKAMFCQSDDLHIGATAGSDKLKGQNINVIGTHHQPEWLYKLIAHSFGLDFDTEARLKQCTIERNGYRFNFMTFEDEVLRNIQLYLIESEAEQAVGRARLLRCDCIVNLFSNFPIRQAIIKKWADEKETAK